MSRYTLCTRSKLHTCAISIMLAELELDSERASRRCINHGIVSHDVGVELLWSSMLSRSNLACGTCHSLVVDEPFVKASKESLYLFHRRLTVHRRVRHREGLDHGRWPSTFVQQNLLFQIYSLNCRIIRRALTSCSNLQWHSGNNSSSLYVKYNVRTLRGAWWKKSPGRAA